MRFEKPGESRVFLWAEFLFLFAGVPLLILALRRPGILFLVLWGGGPACWLASRAVPRGRAQGWREMLRRFALCGAALTLAGGWLFARSYAATRSLTFSGVEHALYGCLVFTIGLGQYFYTGAAWHH
ncbi:hypothetical protein [Acidocella facilis]|uniref:hypothetical protein n=1 Tax=Acidocella facilis TaxID=525 RepID=UPI001F18B75D|nr:hypothetical protein [Acidocella facilis]